MYKRTELPPAHCLSQAAAEGDADKLATLLSAVSMDKSTLNEALLQATLHCSTATDHLECVETLLGKGAAVNYRAEGVTVLMKACELGQIQLVEMLLQRGANIGERGREGRTPLHFAVDTNYGDNSDVVQFLISQGGDANAGDIQNRTPLHIAAMKGFTQSLKALLAAGGRAKALDKSADTPLSLATKFDRVACVQVLSEWGKEARSEQESGVSVVRSAECKEIEKEEAPSYLTTGVELGEELETKSGSSHTSGRGLLDSGVDALPYAPPPSLFPVLHSSRNLTQALTEEIHLLSLEAGYLQELLACETAAQTRFLSRILAIQEFEREESVRRRFRPHPLLNLKPKAPNQSLKSVTSALQDDICKLQRELETWQQTMSPVLIRTVENWRTLIQTAFPASQVCIYGSFANWLHLPSSDIDLLIVNSGLPVLETLQEIEKRAKTRPEVSEIHLISQTFIPVLQLLVDTEIGKVKVDVTVNEDKHRGMKCTQVVRTMLQSHPHLRIVFLTLKQMFHYCEANQPFKGGLGSYSLFLMTAALLRKEVRTCPAEYVLRFFQYYGFEFQYCEGIGVEQRAVVLPCPSLVVQDAACPDHNTARATSLPFLLVLSTQHFLQVSCFHLLSPAMCKCTAGRHVLLRAMLATKGWLSSRSKSAS